MLEFNNLEEYENYIKNNGTDDVVKIGDSIYTMDYYDSVGELITYGNKKNRKGFLVETQNRYGINKFEDANCEFQENIILRDDISYYE